jgi:hypothetical protein
MGNKNKSGREPKKPKKSAKLKAAPLTSAVIPTTARPTENKSQ